MWICSLVPQIKGTIRCRKSLEIRSFSITVIAPFAIVIVVVITIVVVVFITTVGATVGAIVAAVVFLFPVVYFEIIFKS